MNAVRIGVITLCLAAGTSGYLSLRDAATRDMPSSQSTRAQMTQVTSSPASVHSPFSDAAPREVQPPAIGEVGGVSGVSELASESDTTGLLAPTATLDELLDAFNADVGQEGEPVDRETLAAVLRADPELARMLRN
jgi:hypothetical protein